MNDTYKPKVWATNPEYLNSDEFKVAVATGVASGTWAVDAKYLTGQVITDEAMTRNMNTYDKAVYQNNKIKDKAKNLGIVLDEIAQKNSLLAENSDATDSKNKKLLWIGGGIFLLLILGLLGYYFTMDKKN